MQQRYTAGGIARCTHAREIRHTFGGSRFDAAGHYQRIAAHDVHGSPNQHAACDQNDPDDDHVLACAVAAQADLIVSGDKHLHSLGGLYNNIRIALSADAVKIIEGG